MNFPDDPISRLVRWTARICALATAGMGIWALRTWLAGIHPARGGESVVMTPNSAASFIFLGFALLMMLAPWRYRWVDLIGHLLVGWVLVISAARLMETWGGLHLGVDHWLFHLPRGWPGHPFAGATSSITAVNFLLAGAGVLLLAAPPLRQRLTDTVAGLLGLSVLVISLAITLMAGNGRSVPITATAGIAFGLLGLSLLLAATLHDLTERRANRRRQRAQHAVSRVLAESASLAAAGPEILRALCESLHWEFGTLWKRDEAANVLRCVATWRTAGVAADAFEALTRVTICAPGSEMPGRVWQTRQPEWTADLAAAPPCPRTQPAVAAGLRGGFAIPILLEKECLGALEFFSKEMQPPDADLRSIMRAVASQIGLFIQHKAAEEALGRERNLLRAIIDNLPDHIYMKDCEGRYIVDNAAHSLFLGVTKSAEIVGKTVFDFFSSELAGAFTDDDQIVIASDKPILNREEPITSANGERGWVSTSKLPFHDEIGSVIGLVCVSRDITARKRAEENLHAAQLQLIQAEKLESLGRLAAGIAHEVKNPLAMLLMGIDYLESGMIEMEDPAAREVLASMRESVRRADSIIREMLDFSAPKPFEMQPTSVNALILESLPLIRHELDASEVSLVKELAEELPPVVLDPNKIKQVFINLFTNAIHAMPLGGTLSVRTSASYLTAEDTEGRDEGSRRNERRRVGDAIVAVTIDDTGTGIPPDKLASIFDPFFTTKPTGKGTGLGLSVTKKIVELHGGEIRLANRPEGGARVTLKFKGVPQAAAAGTVVDIVEASAV